MSFLVVFFLIERPGTHVQDTLGPWIVEQLKIVFAPRDICRPVSLW